MRTTGEHFKYICVVVVVLLIVVRINGCYLQENGDGDDREHYHSTGWFMFHVSFMFMFYVSFSCVGVEVDSILPIQIITINLILTYTFAGYI